MGWQAAVRMETLWAPEKGKYFQCVAISQGCKSVCIFLRGQYVNLFCTFWFMSGFTAQQINLHKAFHFFCCHQTHATFPATLHYDTILWKLRLIKGFFCIDKRAVFFFKGKSIQMVFLPPTRWFSSSVSFPTPARMHLIYGRYQTRTTTLRSGSPLTVSTIFIFLVSCVCSCSQPCGVCWTSFRNPDPLNGFQILGLQWFIAVIAQKCIINPFSASSSY